MAMIVAYEWGIRPTEILNWTEDEIDMALAYLKWKNARPESQDQN